MSNPKYSFEECAIEMHSERLIRTRYDADKDEFDTRVTVLQAFVIAERALEQLFHDQHPDPAPAKPKAEKVAPLPGLGAPPCTTHKEKSFTFSDGSVMEACTHHECGWGRTRKTHSDGVLGQTLYSIEIPDAVVEDAEDAVEDSQPGTVEELSVEAWAGASPTEDENGNVIETTDDEDEAEESNDGHSDE